MQACAIDSQTECFPEGYGSSVAVVVSQDGQDTGGWILDLYALSRDAAASRVFVGTTTLGAPNTTTRRPARVVMTCSIPGAYRFAVIVTAPQLGSPNRPTKPILVGVFCGDVSANPFNAGT